MNQGQNLIAAATTGPPGVGLGPVMGNGGPVPEAAGPALAQAGFAVMGNVEAKPLATPVKKMEPLASLIGDFTAELSMARMERFSL